MKPFTKNDSRFTLPRPAAAFALLLALSPLSLLPASAAPRPAGRPAPDKSAANELRGSYQVVSVTDLGAEVHVTLHIRLTNATASTLSITKVGLRLAPAARGQADTAASLPLGPRKTGSIDQDFTISPQAYRAWRKGAPIPLALTYDSGSGRTVVRTIALVRQEVAE